MSELMGYMSTPHNWKEYIFREMFSLSCGVDWFRVERTATKHDKQSFHLWFFFGWKSRRRTHVDYTIPQKVHDHKNWKRDQDTVHWMKLSRAQDWGLQFWQTKSSAIITRNPVPGGCIFRVMSEKGDRVLFEGLSTPRPAPKVTLKSNWLVQQQQLTRNVVVNSTSKGIAEWKSQSGTRDGTRDVTGVEIAFGKNARLRVQGVAQDAILQDEANMQEINQPVNKVEAGSNKSSIRNDLSKDKMIFSEESSRAIFEMMHCGTDWVETDLGNYYSMSVMLGIRIWGHDHL